MSYCRFGDDSGIYMYGGSKAIECCGCKFSPETYHPINALIWLGMYITNVICTLIIIISWGKINLPNPMTNYVLFRCKPMITTGEDPSFTTYQEAIDHLKLHKKEGHKVPRYAIKRLREEKKEHGDQYNVT